MVVQAALASTLCRVTGNLFSNNSALNLQPKLLGLFKIAAASYKGEPSHFMDFNKVVYPPQEPGEPPRPAFICHQKTNVKYQPKKLYVCACLIRGMTVDEALKQLKQVPRKGAVIIADTLKEARDLAVTEHNVEFKSNLWVAESFVSKGITIKGVRKHAKGRHGIIFYRYSHYFVRLEEGTPPKDYYWDLPRDGPSALERYVEQLRARRIINSL